VQGFEAQRPKQTLGGNVEIALCEKPHPSDGGAEIHMGGVPVAASTNHEGFGQDEQSLHLIRFTRIAPYLACP
jgi:hypothetical protein